MRITQYDRYVLDGKPVSMISLNAIDIGSGWIDLDLFADALKIPIACSSVFDPFPNLLAWLKAIVCGVERCSFLIEEEGPEKIFWAKRFYGEIYQLKLLKSYGPNKEILNVYVHRAQLIEALYGSIVRFYHSDAYNKDEHELLMIEEKFIQSTGRILLSDSHIKQLLTFKGKKLRYLFLALRHENVVWNDALNFTQNCLQWIKIVVSQKEKYTLESPYWFEKFDTGDLENKVNAIVSAAKSEVSEYGYSFSLKRFHSPLIEDFLLNQSTKDILHMDSIVFDHKIISDEKEHYLKITTYINGINFFSRHVINIFCLEASTKKSGQYALFVCTCGDEGCGGIENSPDVMVDETTITWNIYEPATYKLRFDKETLVKTISHLKKTLLHEKPLKQWEEIEYTPCMSVASFLKSA